MLPLSVASACSINGATEASSLFKAKVSGTTHHRNSTTGCPPSSFPPAGSVTCSFSPSAGLLPGEGRREPTRAAAAARRLGWLAPPLVAAVVALSPPYLVATPAVRSILCFPIAVSVGQPVEVSQKGAALFQRACIGCHDGGGNILQPGATLFMRDLQRNGAATDEEIYNITYFGKGRMPGFGEKCTPRGQCTFGARLQEEEIKQLAEFVKSQADRGWPKLEVYGD